MAGATTGFSPQISCKRRQSQACLNYVECRDYVNKRKCCLRQRLAHEDADERPDGFFTAWPSLEISAEWTGGRMGRFLAPDNRSWKSTGERTFAYSKLHRTGRTPDGQAAAWLIPNFSLLISNSHGTSRQPARFSLAISGTTSPKGMDAEGESPRHGLKKRSEAAFLGALPGFPSWLVKG